MLVILSAFSSALSLASLDANAELRAIGRQVMAKHGLNRGAPMGCLTALTSLASLGLWIAYAFEVGDWRFAAIFALPWLVTMVATPLHTAFSKPRTAKPSL